MISVDNSAAPDGCNAFVEGAPGLAHPCRVPQAGAKAISGTHGLPCTKQDVRKLLALILLQLGSLLYYKGTRGISGGRKYLLDGFGGQNLTFEE